MIKISEFAFLTQISIETVNIRAVLKNNGCGVVKFLDDYIHIHGLSTKVTLDEARCQNDIKVKLSSKSRNFKLIPAPANGQLG